MIAHENRFVLLSSPGMHDFAKEVIAYLIEERGVSFSCYEMEFTQFANGEYLARIPETIRGQHVFLLHGLQYPDPNNAIMMMLIACDAIMRASASGITLVTPYLSYMRQDRKDKPRVPITARLIANLIETNKMVRSLITMDMHAEQEQGFFSIPVDNLTGVKIFSEHVLEKFNHDLSNVVMLGPDFGSALRNRRMARTLGYLPVSILEKRRLGPNEAEIVSFNGDVKGKIVISHEDMVDTGTTIIEVKERAMNEGALEFYLCATHGIFSNGAEERFAQHDIQVACTDSIPRSDEYYAKNPWLTKVSIVPYIAKAIYETTLIGGSVSKLA
jgi:ribose-phosphate pyrophosphokinase